MKLDASGRSARAMRYSFCSRWTWL